MTERETEAETERKTEAETERKTEAETERKTEAETEAETERAIFGKGHEDKLELKMVPKDTFKINQ